jgi:hypothetical protein
MNRLCNRDRQIFLARLSAQHGLFFGWLLDRFRLLLIEPVLYITDCQASQPAKSAAAPNKFARLLGCAGATLVLIQLLRHTKTMSNPRNPTNLRPSVPRPGVVMV